MSDEQWYGEDKETSMVGCSLANLSPPNHQPPVGLNVTGSGLQDASLVEHPEDPIPSKRRRGYWPTASGDSNRDSKERQEKVKSALDVGKEKRMGGGGVCCQVKQ